MKMQRSPNHWSCLPCAFTMVTGKPLEELIAKIGHDGSEIIWPELPEPQRRRSFHLQELVDVAFPTTVIEAEPISQSAEDKQFTPFKDHFSRLQNYMKTYDGVIIGMFGRNPHAAAWDHVNQLIYDPNGQIYQNHKLIKIRYFAIPS
jgi:hypothetical protein